MRGHDVDDEQNRRLIVIAVKLHRDDLQLTVAFVPPDVTPGRVALIGDSSGGSCVSHDVPNGGPTDAVLACSLGKPNLHTLILSDTSGCVKHNQSVTCVQRYLPKYRPERIVRRRYSGRVPRATLLVRGKACDQGL